MASIRSWLEHQNPGTVLVVGVTGTALAVLYFLARLAMHPTERRLDRMARAMERRPRV
jgi:hypothetical protein